MMMSGTSPSLPSLPLLLSPFRLLLRHSPLCSLHESGHSRRRPAPLHVSVRPLSFELKSVREWIKRFDARRLSRKIEKREEIREEMRNLPSAQIQTLYSGHKNTPQCAKESATSADEAEPVLPRTRTMAECPVVDANGTRHDLSRLLHTEGKVTALHISFNQHTFELGQVWLKRAQQRWKEEEKLQHSAHTLQTLTLSLIKQRWIRELFGKASLNTLRTLVKEDQREQTLSLLSTPHYKELENFSALRLNRNELLGHFLLIDSKGRLRWRAWGPIEEGEEGILVKALLQIVGEESVRL